MRTTPGDSIGRWHRRLARLVRRPPPGFVERIDSRQISGWARDVQNLSVPATLEIRINGEVIATPSCGEIRSDAERLGHTGARHFTFDPSAALPPGRSLVEVRIKGARSGLAGGRAWIESEIPERVAEYWSSRLEPEALLTRWWQCEAIVRHINQRVCGRPLPGLSDGLFERVRESHAHRLPFSRGVSIGCGGGLKEIAAMRAGLVDRFTLFELTAPLLDLARQSAEEQGLASRIDFRNEDAFAEVGESKCFDLVFWNNSLHHMLDVEAAVSWSHRVLRPGGILMMDDYVGPNRFQWTDEMIRVNTAFRRSLPRDYLVDPYGDGARLLPVKVEAPPAEAIARRDPSECVDSERIHAALRKHFSERDRVYTGGVIYHAGLNDLLHNVLARGDDEVIRRALELDDQCADRGLTHYAAAIAEKR